MREPSAQTTGGIPVLLCGRDFDAAIFDFDGTLADSMWVWNHVDEAFLARRGIPYDPTYAERIAVLGFELGAPFTIEHFGLDERPEDIIKEWKASAADGYATQVMLKPGARECLERIAATGTPLALATSLQRNLLEPCLKNNGVFGMFRHILVCDELQCGGKSNPTIYLEAAKRLGAPPERCIVFEDVAVAAQSAKNAGAFVVGVYDSHKQQATDELQRIVDVFIHDFAELWEEA